MKKTALHSLHETLGAKLVPFAGYSMPLSYPAGIINEHLHTRASASLFDVSHMGQLVVSGKGATARLESLLPLDLDAMAVNRQSYALLTNEAGGIRDDLMLTRWAEDEYYLVVNAACKDADLAYLRQALPDLKVSLLEDHSLLALQGPAAHLVLKVWIPALDELGFMQACRAELNGIPCHISRSGYTGEDGFEISTENRYAEALAQALLASEAAAVQAAGLGARDSLRLEAGLCLYGHELDSASTPLMAGLGWSISKSRRSGGSKAGGFPGADRILQEFSTGPEYERVGLLVAGRVPVREGAQVLAEDGSVLGSVCSGGYSPVLQQPLAMAYVRAGQVSEGAALQALVRNRVVDLQVVRMPFVPHRYYRK